MREFLPVNNSKKTKWPAYFVERIPAGEHFWKTKWPAYFDNTEFLPASNSEKTKWQVYFIKANLAVNEMTGILKYSAEILIPGRNSEIFLFVEN